MAPEARWIPFTAEEFIESTCSGFRWEAQVDPGKIGSPTVVDSYEQEHGRMLVKVGGLLPLRKVTGPDADRGELQRYLASVVFCPPMLVNHASLECTLAGPLTLRLRDKADLTGTSIDLDLSEQGQPLACRADRPRLVGKQAVLTPWTGHFAEFQVWEGLRIASRLEVAWHLPEGPFAYFRCRIISFAVLL